MLALTPPPGGADITWLTAFAMLAIVAAGGLVYGFVMSLIYRRRSHAVVHEISPSEVRKAA